MRAIDRFERFGQHVHNGQDHLKNHIFQRFPVVHTEEEVYQQTSPYAWLVDPNIYVYDSFPWYYRPNPDEELAVHAFPYVYKESRKVKDYDRVKLVPTKKGTYKTKKHAYICGEYDVYKGQEQFDIFYLGENKSSHRQLIERFPQTQIVYNFREAQERAYTDMFWLVYDDTLVRKTFKFSYHPDEWSHNFVHVFGNGDIDRLDGVALVPKHADISDREIEHRFFVNKKEVRIMASDPLPYPKFTVNNYKDYEIAYNSTSDMFWGLPTDIEVSQDFDFKFTFPRGSKDKDSNHVWKNGNRYDGLVLYSKKQMLSEKELAHRFIVDRIEHEEKASVSKAYEQFTIDCYDDYKAALKKSKTDLFWGVPSDVTVLESFGFESYLDSLTALDRTTNHVFLNDESYDGIVLFSKQAEVTEKEIAHRFLINKKEHEIVASSPKIYDKFVVNNYEDYVNALNKSSTQMFWGIPDDIVVDYDFSLYFSHHNQYDRNINHVFLNGENYDGLVLFSKDCVVSEKEIDHRFFIKKKEWDIVASKPKPFDKFEISNYDDYKTALENTTTDMFFMTYPEINIATNFDFDFYISHHDQYDRKLNHVWKNGEFYDGIALTNKKLPLSEKEIQYRFFAHKKEYDRIGSMPKAYDIVFISYNEPNADENYKLLLERFPNAKRVHGVTGIHQAHIEAAKQCSTDMFWVVDGDAKIIDDFDFEHQIAHYDIDGRNTVHVWRSLNPINQLVYGYGGVKLLPRQLTLEMDIDTPDMTTSISDKFKAMPAMSNTSEFAVDEFSAWRSAFRECVKLSSKSIHRQKDDETEFRLNAWCTRGADKPFGTASIAGAIEGKRFGEEYAKDKTMLKKINDFSWLEKRFKQSYQQV